jgi:hypothetical protein
LSPTIFCSAPKAILAKILDVNLTPYDRVSKFEPVAWKRCFSELCGGTGGVFGAGVARPSGRHCGVFADANASSGHPVRDGAIVDAFDPDADVCEFYDACGAVRGADDCADGHFAVHGQCQDGWAASEDGVDTGDSYGQPVAGRVQPIAPDFGFVGERCIAAGVCSDVPHGA